jgi:hypothetical protein
VKQIKNKLLTLYVSIAAYCVSHNGSWLVLVDGVCLQSLEDGISAILKMLEVHVDCIHPLLLHIQALGDCLKCTIKPCCKLTYLLHTA